MAQQPIIIGTADAKAGDTLFDAFTKTQSNFTELYAFDASQGAIFINSEASFPTQDATTITLDANTNFILSGSFSTAKRFIVLQGVSFTANNFSFPVLTYTGSGDMFTSSNVTFMMDKIRFDAPNATQGFNCSDVGNVHGVNLRDVFFTTLAKWGTFTSMQALVMDNNVITSSAGEGGVTIAGTGWLAFINERFSVLSSSASFIAVDLGAATFSFLDFSDLVIIAPSGGIGVKGLASSANMVAGSLANISRTTFIGGMTAFLSGITDDDVRYKFDGNAQIPDTNPDLLLSLTGNTTATTVSGGTPALLAGTWNAVERASQFTGTTAGRGTFLGERTMAGPIDVSLTVEPSSGNNKDISAYVAIDGVFQANSQVTVRVDNANPKAISIPWQTDFSNGTFIEIYVSNDTDDISIVGQHAILRIR